MKDRETIDLILQDVNDILHLNIERVVEYNKCAYLTSDMQLKGLLNREADNARENILKLRRLIIVDYECTALPMPAGQIVSDRSYLRPSFNCDNFEDQLNAFELSDLITLQCYKLVLSKASLDVSIRSLLEFQYYNGLTLYKAIKSFREAYSRNKFNHSARQLFQ